MTLKVASFFAGIGGFDIAFEKVGMKVVFQCEIDKFCRAVLKKHWPKAKLLNDIDDISKDEIPPADLWCGGFPCQDLSLANQGKRRGLNGKRSGLFFKFAELIEAKRPRWIVIENVSGLLNSNDGEDFKVLLETLDELGYCLAWRILDAKFFGTPQRRRRVFIVGSYRTRGAIEVLFGPDANAVVPRKGESKEQGTSQKSEERNTKTDIYTIQHAAIGRKPEAGPQSKGYRNDGETWTLDSRGSADVVCKTNDAFRVRGVTRVSRWLDGPRYRAIGNAVAVPVATWIGKRIMEVEKSKK